MTITKDIWMSLSKAEKKAKMVEALTLLYNIDNGKHPLSNKLDQGRLPKVKKDTEAFIIDATQWESDKQLEHKPVNKYA